MLEILEPINVWVFFKKNLIKPHLFFWRGRKIKVDKINLIHTSKNGSSLFYHFSISSGGNFYRLKFDTNKLDWFLEAVEEG
ncbi:hypothetical protein HYW43_01200 [Candidatus Daviesbacteria bacterium]|nr:hypothetical protein [Candidatus Daviesbacteria bacterium]